MNIAVLLSGGVDSSVALHQVKNDGDHRITAYYLKIWLEDDVSFLGECPWEDDLAYARAVCQQAGVELRVLPLQLEYYDKVVSYALAELRQGRTPSPDIFCNQRIKFGAFFDAVTEEYDRVVTGHYARVETDSHGRTHLYQAPDPVKDQSYFLSHLSQKQVAKLWFPLGGMEKRQVRELAAGLDLPNKDRKDSQGICFLGKIKYPDFVRHYLGEKDGDIVRRETGEVLGGHKGFWFHTIGQRSGLGLGNGPWYVVDKDPDTNTVFVSHADDLTEAFHHEFICTELTWIGDNAPTWLGAGTVLGERIDDRSSPREFSLKLRHGPKMTRCAVRPADEADLDRAGVPRSTRSEGGPRLVVTMEEGDKGLAPGQFAVFYLDDECIGSGKIERAIVGDAVAPAGAGAGMQGA
jgi:tRNA (5-methylaminomethyl-2-thiouridylate)-methyltransferase